MREPSIKRKLTLAITLTSGVAVLLAYSASVALEVAALHRAVIGLGVLGACLALGLLVSARLQRHLVAPISELTTAARRVSREQDYSARAGKHANDELGALVDEFNAMLSSFHDRDQQLQAEVEQGARELQEALAGRRELEDEIGERTRELERETAARQQAEKTARRLADFDPMTGLPNRVLFNDRLAQAIARAQRHKLKPSVMVLDLDHFKTINDTLGKAVGDQVLRGVAERLAGCLRVEDTVARLGGDEFQVLLPSHSGPGDAITVAEKLLHALRPPFSVEGHELYVGASIGISMYPADGESAEALVKNADAALHRAKEQGRNSYQLYAPAMNAAAMKRLVLEGDLRRALEREEFVLHYQPVVDPASGAILSVEALVRWRHPKDGLRGPGSFIPLAEETGLIVPLGEWVLRTACRQCKSWQTLGLPAVRVSVNVSARQFRQADFVRVVESACEEAELDPSRLTLEVTESLIMEHADSTIGMLNELKQLGVAISIDDFGTGYSSLSYLKRLPIDILKIDRSFVRDIPDDPDDSAIATLIISLAHGLQLTVVAEGVETEAQLAFLLPRHCDAMQGYLFSRPVPAEDMTLLLAGPRVCRASPTTPPALAT